MTSLQTHGQGSRISKCASVFNSNDLKRVSGADPVFNSNDLIRVSGADPDYDSGQRKLSSMDCHQYYYNDVIDVSFQFVMAGILVLRFTREPL